MDDDTKQAFEALEAKMEAMQIRLLERIEQTETKLLRAFLGWGRATDAKLRALPLLDERITNMEERVSELERKNLERGT
jgi:hypothetical protein